MSAVILVVIYSVLIMAASLLGGFLPQIIPLRQRGMQLMMCFVAGLMIGVAILHLIPHGYYESGSIDAVAMACLCGVLLMWALVRLFHFHQHVTVDDAGHVQAVDCSHEHEHLHEHDHDHLHGAPLVQIDAAPMVQKPVAAHDHGGKQLHRYSWVGVAFGLGLHTMIDGVAVGAAVVADAAHGGAIPLYGIGVFLAVLLHKPMDSLAVTAMMGASGWSARAQTLVNFAFATMCPIGAALVLIGASQMTAEQHYFIGCALGFSAGVFLWISLGDLLPDVHFHSGDRTKFAVALLTGVVIAYGIGFLEPKHLHEEHDHGHEHSHDHGHSH